MHSPIHPPHFSRIIQSCSEDMSNGAAEGEGERRTRKAIVGKETGRDRIPSSGVRTEEV